MRPFTLDPGQAIFFPRLWLTFGGRTFRVTRRVVMVTLSASAWGSFRSWTLRASIKRWPCVPMQKRMPVSFFLVPDRSRDMSMENPAYRGAGHLEDAWLDGGIQTIELSEMTGLTRYWSEA